MFQVTSLSVHRLSTLQTNQLFLLEVECTTTTRFLIIVRNANKLKRVYAESSDLFIYLSL